MQQSCSQCGTSFEITDDDLKYYEKVVIPVPPPKMCPECRQQRRLAFRNERRFYNDKCDHSGENMISIYAPESPFTVYDYEIWWSDDWDPLEYGQEYDFNRPFFDQFAELQKKVPRPNLFGKANVNSKYTNHVDNAKNSYMCADVGFGEDVLFSKYVISAKNIVDSYMTSRSELCYETMYTEGYNCKYTHLCEDITDCNFVFDCKGCRNCALCWNLRGKSYCFKNKQLTKEEYENELSKMNLHTHSGFEKAKSEFSKLILNAARQPCIQVNCEDCTAGTMHNCKNVHNSFDIGNARDCKYCYMCDGLTDCYDTFESAFDCELQCEGYACNRAQRIFACSISYDVHDCLYCDVCHNSSELFGCVGLRHKQHCILNKQYSKEEYEELVPKIVEHMKQTREFGEFFPVTLSPFAYNETVAPEYFPLTREEVESRGWKWRDQVDEIPKVEKIIPAEQLPDSIDDIPDSSAVALAEADDILNWAIKCEATERPFIITKQELAFYRQMKLPIPHLHPDERHKRRMARRDPSKLWDRTCGKCRKKIRSTYAPERAEKKIFCEECYLAEVY